jgi:hypothetical protein
MREKEIETHLRVEVNKLGGIAYKFSSPGRVNVPDRICIMPTGEVIFVECKAPGKRPTKGQIREHQRLRQLKQMVFVVDSKGGVDAVLAKWQ